MISHAPPFVLRLSKDERKVFQQNHMMMSYRKELKKLETLLRQMQTGR